MSSNSKISRRGFGTLAAALLLPASFSSPAAAAPRRRSTHSTMKHLIKPPRLKKGDLVGLIAPGGYTSDAAIQKAVQHIEALGFRVKPGNYLREVWGNYGGTVA